LLSPSVPSAEAAALPPVAPALLPAALGPPELPAAD
jgi:hypothetical protein